MRRKPWLVWMWIATLAAATGCTALQQAEQEGRIPFGFTGDTNYKSPYGK